MFRFLLLLNLLSFATSEARVSFDDKDIFPQLFAEEMNDPNLNPGFDLDAFRQDQFNLHNYYRAKHGVPLMTLDETLTQQAQTYAERLASEDNGLVHCANRVDCNVHGAGENLATAFGSTEAETNATKAWYDEILYYNFCFDLGEETSNRPGYEKEDIGHFTQVVWKTSTLLGIGYARTADRTKVFVVGRYKEHGNVQGRYNENVEKPDDISETFQNNCDGTDGGFTKFMGPGECSRSCGGGVQFLTRTCTNPKPSLNGRDCVGETKQLVREWCNSHECSGDKSHRDLQCEERGFIARAHNFEGPNDCKLHCFLRGSTFFNRGNVDDGTHCNDDKGACVNGVCETMPEYVVRSPPPPTPDTTTTEPVTTTTKPETTTKTPSTTKTESETTTKEPETTTTTEPETTTKKPETTTTEPETTTKEPETTTTEKPEITTKEPETTTTTELEKTTKETKSTTTTKPETTTKKPETTTTEPEATTQKPETTTKKSEATTTGPETSTKEPETSTKKSTTENPKTTTQEPKATTTKKLETTASEMTTTKQPEITTTEQQRTSGLFRESLRPGSITPFLTVPSGRIRILIRNYRWPRTIIRYRWLSAVDNPLFKKWRRSRCRRLCVRTVRIPAQSDFQLAVYVSRYVCKRRNANAIGTIGKRHWHRRRRRYRCFSHHYIYNVQADIRWNYHTI